MTLAVGLLCVCAGHASQDPFPKPCYLFSLVAGDLALREDSHTTHTGRTISLKTYVPAAYIDQVRQQQTDGNAQPPLVPDQVVPDSHCRRRAGRKPLATVCLQMQASCSAPCMHACQLRLHANSLLVVPSMLLV
jgi:hypothetical protein